MSYTIDIESYDGGYRPTAIGKINGRSFAFRVMGDRWRFVVATDDNVEVWWHSGDDEVGFERHGIGERPGWHTETLDLFLKCVREYLAEVGADSADTDRVVAEATRQARTLFE